MNSHVSACRDVDLACVFTWVHIRVCPGAQADLAPLALQLACWGVSVSHTDQVLTALPWLDPPPVKRLADAAELLQELGAITDKVGRTVTCAYMHEYHCMGVQAELLQELGAITDKVG